ncbi:MAG: hypothetical protein JWN37_888 [Candidatus Nomurabacteria bacterium]|nr:hypothetical protein [Candidatus Nomurabacteria bacterium]
METEPRAVATHSRYLMYVGIFFVAVLMVSNTVGSKLVEIGPFIFAGATFIFPLSYIFGDVLTEVYGYKESRKIVWAGFAVLILMTLCYVFVQYLPYPAFWQNQAAYEAILGATPRILVAGMIAYFIGEFANSYVLSRMKVWSQGKYLWMRTIGSTIVGEGLDTTFFILIGFWGIIPNSAILTTIISGYLAKVLIEVVLTPVTYFVINKLKKAEGLDVYDKGISYNPFTFEGK